MKTAYESLKYRERSSDVLQDCVDEMAVLLEITESQAQLLVHRVLDFYHFKTAPFPHDVPGDVLDLAVHVTQPFRLPHMTQRMDALLEQLAKENGLRNVLDYGGGGGKDSIIFARANYNVTYADYAHVMDPYIRKRFKIRDLENVRLRDVRYLAENERYDIINCMDVVEHIYDVEYAIADLVSRLREGGHLLLCPAFYNDWTGDHVEKNCGYRPYFTEMLLKVGLETVSPLKKPSFMSRAGLRGNETILYHLRRVRKVNGSTSEEREYIRRELYALSRHFSARTMLYCGAVLPVALAAHLCFQVMRNSRLQRILPVIANNFFDNYAIGRLSRHRLETAGTAQNQRFD